MHGIRLHPGVIAVAFFAAFLLPGQWAWAQG